MEAGVPKMRPVEDRQYTERRHGGSGLSGALFGLVLFALGAGAATLLSRVLPDDGGLLSWKNLVLLALGGVVALAVTKIQSRRRKG